MNIRVWFLSDTHALHGYLAIPENIDIVIHAGDASNFREPVPNYQEMLNFIEWYKNLKIEHKVYIPGNHDTSVEKRLITPADMKSMGIMCLETSSTSIKGLNIYGSPYTPTFGFGWAYNKNRDKMHKQWQSIPENSDIVVTHGPPFGILDVSEDREGNLEHCGDRSLMKRLDTIKPIIYCSGHIHDSGENRNSGVYINKNTLFINASCVIDGKFAEGPSSNGTVVTINIKSKKVVDIEVL